MLDAFLNEESSFEAQDSRCLKNFQENNYLYLEYVTIEINNSWLRAASLSRASIHVHCISINIQIVSLELKSSMAII